MDIAALVISILALALSAFQFFNESSRQKKESTLDAYDILQNDVFSKINIILQNLRANCSNLYDIEYNSEYWQKITTYLAKIERFCVGVNSGVYSLRVLNRVGGGYFIRVFLELKPIIYRKRQKNVSSGKHYDEFELTVTKLKKMRKIDI